MISISCMSGCYSNQLPITPPSATQNFPLALEWSNTFDDNINGMAVGNGTAIVGLIGIDKKVMLYAYDVYSGTAKWSTTIDGNNFAINLKIYDGEVFVAYPPNFYALNLEDGSLIWETTDLDTGNKIVAVSERHLLVLKTLELVAYNIKTGNTTWSIAIDRGNKYVFFEDETDIVYFLTGTKIQAIKDENGEILWTKDTHLPGTMVFQDGVIYVNNDTAGVTLDALDIFTQNTIWQTNLDSPSEYLMVWKDQIIGISTDRFVSIERETGKKNWEYLLPLGPYRPPVRIDNTAYIRNVNSNQIIAWDLNGGDMLGKLNLPARDSIMIVRDDDLLSVDSYDPVLVLYVNDQLFVYGEK